VHGSFKIKTDNLHTVGSEVGGGRLELEVKNVEAIEVPLYSMQSGSSLEVGAGLKVGVRENVSGLIDSSGRLIDAASEIDRNPYAIPDIALSGFSAFMALTNIAAGNIISSGAFVNVHASMSKYKITRKEYVGNRFDFERIEGEVSGVLRGNLEILAKENMLIVGSQDLRGTSAPEEHRSGISAGISVSSSGAVNVNARSIKDQKQVGVGLSFNIGSGSSGKEIFGPTLSVDYADKRGHFAGSVATFDPERVKQAYSGGVSGFVARAQHNITSEVAHLGSLISSPLTAIPEEITNQLNELRLGLAPAAGDEIKLTDEEKKLRNEHFKKPLELLWEFNPDKTAEYCLVILYDPGVNYDKSTHQTSEKTIPIGHFYHGVGRVADDGCVKDEIWGYGPDGEISLPIARAIFEKEDKRYTAITLHELSNRKLGSLVIQKSIPITTEQYGKYQSFIASVENNPGTYIGHINDCITNTQKALESVGLGHVKVQDIINTDEITSFSLAKFSSYFRQNPKTVPGVSKEDVAQRLKITIDRIKEVVPAEDSDNGGWFEIEPLSNQKGD
jgi:hypothetical protein